MDSQSWLTLGQVLAASPIVGVVWVLLRKLKSISDYYASVSRTRRQNQLWDEALEVWRDEDSSAERRAWAESMLRQLGEYKPDAPDTVEKDQEDERGDPDDPPSRPWWWAWWRRPD